MQSAKSIFYIETLINENTNIKWGWFVLLGLVVLILGVLAFGNLTLATNISIFYVGVFMAMGGFMQIIHSFQLRSWSGFFYYLLSGILYLAAGVIAFQNPLLAAATLTLYLGVTLIVSGVIRMWSVLRLRGREGWLWFFSSGLISVFAGFVFVIDWPVNAIWFLGMVLAVDLTFQGVAILMLGLNLRTKKIIGH